MLESLRQQIADLLQEPEERLVIGGTLVLILAAALVYVTLKVRERVLHGGSGSSDHLSTFRELYEAGEISEFEYRRVRMKLSDSVQKEMDSKLQAAIRPESENVSSSPARDWPGAAEGSAGGARRESSTPLPSPAEQQRSADERPQLGTSPRELPAELEQSAEVPRSQDHLDEQEDSDSERNGGKHE